MTKWGGGQRDIYGLRAVLEKPPRVGDMKSEKTGKRMNRSHERIACQKQGVGNGQGHEQREVVKEGLDHFFEFNGQYTNFSEMKFGYMVKSR